MESNDTRHYHGMFQSFLSVYADRFLTILKKLKNFLSPSPSKKQRLAPETMIKIKTSKRARPSKHRIFFLG